jgi:hypothetical protein
VVVTIATRFYDVLVVGHPADRRKWEELVSMGSRPLTALAFAVLAGLGFVFLIPDCASACTCGSTSSNGQKEIESELSSSEAVFSGEVVDFEKGSSIAAPWPTETVSFRVSEVWKGPERETLGVSTATQGSACGYAFKEGREYLVYAYGKQDLEVDLCSRTKPLSEAGADLALLGNSSEKPKEGGEALSDTSGGVSAGALVALAGLALAASVLVVVRLVRTG